jgi:hypothetical protein
VSGLLYAYNLLDVLNHDPWTSRLLSGSLAWGTAVMHTEEAEQAAVNAAVGETYAQMRESNAAMRAMLSDLKVELALLAARSKR